MKQDVPSPCISVCELDAARRLCNGCLRTLEEIAAWRNLSDNEKLAILKRIEGRKKKRRHLPDYQQEGACSNTELS